MGMPILDDVNGPMLPGAGYINMNIAADGTRMSAARPSCTRAVKTESDSAAQHPRDKTQFSQARAAWA